MLTSQFASQALCEGEPTGNALFQPSKSPARYESRKLAMIELFARNIENGHNAH